MGTLTPLQRGSIVIPAPEGIVRVASPDTRQSLNHERVRIDTGADISVIPEDWEQRLLLDSLTHSRSSFEICGQDHAVYLLEATVTLPGSSPLQFDSLPVIVMNFPLMLLGIHECLEHCRLSIDWRTGGCELVH